MSDNIKVSVGVDLNCVRDLAETLDAVSVTRFDRCCNKITQ